MDISSARDIALKDFDGEEYDHFGKAAYRIKPKKPGGKPGKTFMTLWIEEGFAVLMLDVEQQTDLIAQHPAVFEPHPSKWGAKGATIMHLVRVNEKVFRMALGIARANAEPGSKSLTGVEKFLLEPVMMRPSIDARKLGRLNVFDRPPKRDSVCARCE